MKKQVFSLLLLCALVLTGCGGQIEKTERSDRLQIVTTVFPAYDFARAAAGEWADVKLLLPPGTESHTYEPTPSDILAVQECDLFLYLGGESDAWVETILSAVEMRGTAMRMVDCVDLLEEESVAGMQEEHEDHGAGEVAELDEHVWTSPQNAAAITRAVGEQLSALDGAHAGDYTAAAEAYAAKIHELDGEFAAFFDARTDRTMVFGDRFPLRYFAEEYDLDYYAAFPGCSTQTEPSAATVAFLTDKVRQEKIPTVWYIEFSNHLVADSIAEAAGAKTAMFHSCHNVSKVELDGGATYVTLMQGNLEALKKYL
ncbi:metal ABC transporter substrate-binding protein [Oscillibacter sp.]|uniref:metal ABC transporter substrate-binding protein n=1 Tax=Oscillibacter sp. TaxID=1945593 RepID=UPI002635AEB5|nr:metal ABC transporter substrate-binding protein [Oscillibacter sp.]MDD3347106.1 metal ABC transporter substrate-binding protein [Oscillibacter sp.]